MLPKNRRLTRSQVAYVFKKGTSINGQHFAVRFMPRKSGNTDHFCVMVSMKVAAKAVPRNRLRRQIYEAIRKKVQGTKDKEQTRAKNIVVIAKKSALKLDFPQIEQNIKKILNKLNG